MAEFKAAKVPPEMVPVLAKAEETIKPFFDKVVGFPDQGRIEIDGIRYMWVGANSLTESFRGVLEEVYGPKGADQIIYKFGRAVGMSEARQFHTKFGLKDPMEKLMPGPVYFSYSGWAFVELLPQSAPQPNENYILTYHHPNSFEAEFFLKTGQKADRPICQINAGYSAGWCAESFGQPLEAREITCEAMGDEHCTFLMTHRDKMLPRLEAFKKALAEGREPTLEELLNA